MWCPSRQVKPFWTALPFRRQITESQEYHVPGTSFLSQCTALLINTWYVHGVYGVILIVALLYITGMIVSIVWGNL